MSSESHRSQLERRHADLEQQINEATNHPSADPLELTDLKRRKLRLKDEITKMKTTVH
ncbi:MAG: YdcH family protein [Alphaproteobacteria bacterium]